MATLVSDSYVYLGLPRSGSTYIYNLLPVQSKGHEVLMSQYLQAYKTYLDTCNEYEYIRFIQRRHSILRLKYDIFTMHSLTSSSLLKALPQAYLFALIREPIEWCRSICSYLIDILSSSTYSRTSQSLANAFFHSTIPCIVIESFLDDIKSTKFQEKLFGQLISYWLSRTLDLIQTINSARAFILCLDGCVQYLPDLFLFLGLDPSLLANNKQLYIPANQSSYLSSYLPFLFPSYPISESVLQSQQLYQRIRQSGFISTQNPLNPYA